MWFLTKNDITNSPLKNICWNKSLIFYIYPLGIRNRKLHLLAIKQSICFLKFLYILLKNNEIDGKVTKRKKNNKYNGHFYKISWRYFIEMTNSISRIVWYWKLFPLFLSHNELCQLTYQRTKGTALLLMNISQFV